MREAASDVEMIDRTPAEVFPPGEFIREELEARGWNQVELSEILGRPPRLVSELLAGKRAITPETAKGLGDAFGTGAQFWMNLESSYRLAQVKSDSSNAVSRRAKLYEKAPVKEMMRRHWIEPTENIDVLQKRVLDFFHIASLDEEPQLLPLAARKSTSYSTYTPGEQAWLSRAMQLAQMVDVKPFSEAAFTNALSKLKTLLRDPEGTRQVPRILAEAGVRFLIVETLPQTRIDGACLWLNEKSPVIAMSLRFDRIDSFWHTLLHECAHVKHRDGLEDGAMLDVDLVGEDSKDDTEKPAAETRADDFAADFSIQKSDLDNFILRVRPLFSKIKIQGLAARLNVHQGIVVGQLQKKKAIPWSHSREMLAKIRHIVTEAALTDGFGSILSTTL
jgi:HTH-type transcriptional regulator/antitoxin HigA